MMRSPSMAFAQKVSRSLFSASPATPLRLGVRSTARFSHPTSVLQSRSTMSSAFFDAVKTRRSVYAITPESTIPDEKIQEIISEAIKHAPSSFNVQSSRAVLLLGAEHKKLWQITANVLKEIVPADQFASTQQKLDGFGNGHGTVLFFEDENDVKDLQARFALYQDRFPVWSQHASAILQFIVWTALESEGLGASLQHYNPLITAKVLEEWKLPASWTLIAQLPFGTPAAPAGERTYKPVEDRFKIFGKN
ncbi:putative nitroreductase HBN1 [Grifola frondosa]|uniref:Putative nitroreductase HBN1 n=1 Tax=Grifola frondosa TaxID=5627 RepID=A0A1C7LMB4_GRIFR|nr:putative nitroreductase HBN1 [Grifola frondosa]